MPVTVQPSRVFPATASHGNPAGVSSAIATGAGTSVMPQLT